MPDNTVLNPGVGGDACATDEISDAGVANGAKVQRVKAGWGTDNSYKDPSYSDPFPVAAIQDTSGMSNLGSIVTPKFAVVAVSSSGDNVVVSGVATKKIRVLAYALTMNNLVNVKWRSSTTTDITGLLYISQNGGIVCGHCPVGYFETAAGEGLYLNLSGAVAVGGHLTYVEI